GHKRFTVATNVQVYFCDPRSPWQRGSNENTNGLLRQYFPRGTDLSRFSQAYLNGIALRLNQRPRKTLAFETPPNRLQLVLHLPIELTPHNLPALGVIGGPGRGRLGRRASRGAGGCRLKFTLSSTWNPF